jgi:putative sterol carrier protein
MSQTREFFETYLPNKMVNDPELASSVNAIFQFDIDGAGSWTLDLTNDGVITEGSSDDAGCVITTDEGTWESILDNPGKAVPMVMMGKLKVSNLGLATQLQKILA